LNVGGTVFTTSWRTISKSPRLKKIVIEGLKPPTLEEKRTPPLKLDGKIFIDRDPILFEYILRALRSVKDPNSPGIATFLPSDKQVGILKQIQHEAQYFQLPQLKKSATRATWYKRLLNFLGGALSPAKIIERLSSLASKIFFAFSGLAAYFFGMQSWERSKMQMDQNLPDSKEMIDSLKGITK
jgi:hypothetical protein